LTEKTIKIVILIVLYLLFLIPLTSMDTWDNPYTLHEHAVEMLVQLYDNGAMKAYKSSLDIYLNNGDQSNSIEPIILLSVPNPKGAALNINRTDYRPNLAVNQTEILLNYRSGDYGAISINSSITGFEFVCIYSQKK